MPGGLPAASRREPLRSDLPPCLAQAMGSVPRRRIPEQRVLWLDFRGLHTHHIRSDDARYDSMPGHFRWGRANSIRWSLPSSIRLRPLSFAWRYSARYCTLNDDSSPEKRLTGVAGRRLLATGKGIHMMGNSMLAKPALLAVLAFVPACTAFPFLANAEDILAGGGLVGSSTQSRADCVFYNAGGASVTLRGFEITDPTGTAQTFIINQCGTSPATLKSHQTCGISAAAKGNIAYACRVRVSPNKTDVRGVLDLKDGNLNVLSNVELR